MAQLSFLKVLDAGMKALALAKFGPALGISNLANDVVFFPKDVALRTIAEKRGAAEIEFISVWREGMALDWARQRSPVARRGFYLNYVDENSKSAIVNVKAVPVTLDYNIWVWSRTLDKIMQACETYVFWQHLDPNLSLLYNNVYPLAFDLHFGQIVDESTASMQFEKGLYFVSRMPVRIDGWVFTLTTEGTILKVILQLFYNENLSTATPANSQLLATITTDQYGTIITDPEVE